MFYLQYYFIRNDTFCNTYEKNKMHKCYITQSLCVMLKK